MRIILLLACLVVLTSCSAKENQAITKVEEVPEEPENQPSLIEKKEEGSNTEDQDVFLEFPLEEESISINVSQISILDSYLKGSGDKNAELKNMQLKKLFTLEEKSIYLLQFACRSGGCSYMLLSRGEESFSYLTADFARVKLTQLSPDKTKLLLIFSRNVIHKDTQLALDKLVVIDIEEWGEIPLSNQHHRGNFDFRWPILHAKWKDDSAIEVTLPNIPSPDKELIFNWNSTDRQAVKSEIQLTEKLN